MKNAIIFGAIIGILSGLWLLTLHSFDYHVEDNQASNFEYFSILIPIIGLFFGIRSYRANELGGQMGFFEALIQSFKILLAGGIVAIFAAIVYINYVAAGNNMRDFSSRMFGALLVGIISAFAVSLLLANRSNKIE
jgi:hypothetical protein